MQGARRGSIVDTMDKPMQRRRRPSPCQPFGTGQISLMRRCRLLIGSLPNLVGSALPEGNLRVAAT